MMLGLSGYSESSIKSYLYFKFMRSLGACGFLTLPVFVHTFPILLLSIVQSDSRDRCACKPEGKVQEGNK